MLTEAYWVELTQVPLSTDEKYRIFHKWASSPAEVYGWFDTQQEAWEYIETCMPNDCYMTILPASHRLNPTDRTLSAYVRRRRQRTA